MTCHHEPYQGRCAHCDVPFRNGRPVPDYDAELDAALRFAAESQVLAHKWMVAHDQLKLGKPYKLPSPADVPTIIAQREFFRGALTQLANKARVSGEALGNSPPAFDSCRKAFHHLADFADEALAAATGTAETSATSAECEASQSGPKGNAQALSPNPSISSQGS